jgi:sugar phosphate permease
VLLVALVVQCCVSVTEQGVPTLAVFVKSELGVSAALAGLLVSSLFIGKVAGSYVVGSLVDRHGERRMLVVTAMCAAVLVATASMLPLPGTIVCLVGAGFFTAATAPAGSRLILGSFARTRRGFGMGVRQAGVPLGGLIAALTLPVVAAAAGWRTGLALAGGLMLFGGIAALVLAGVEEPRRRHAPHAASPEWRTLSRDRDLRLLTLWGCMLVSGQYCLLAFLAIDLNERASMALGTAATMVVVAHLGGMLGRLAWGYASDRAFEGGRRQPLGLIALVGILTAVGLAASPPRVPVIALVVIVFVAGVSLLGWQGLWLTLVVENAGAGKAGAAAGFALTFIALVSFATAPLYGLVLDLTGSPAAMWSALAAVLALSFVPLALVRESGMTRLATQ